MVGVGLVNALGSNDFLDSATLHLNSLAIKFSGCHPIFPHGVAEMQDS